MAFRQGSSPNFNYTPISTILPTQKFGGFGLGLQQAIWAQTGNGVGGGTSGCLEKGAADAQGYPTLYIRFVPWPQQSYTVVYGGTRYPTLLNETTPDTTAIPDLPLHFHDGIVWRVLRDAFVRAKADTTEIEREIARFDDSQKAVELRSAQRQGPEMIQNLGSW
jgi:hypothetical protein